MIMITFDGIGVPTPSRRHSNAVVLFEIILLFPYDIHILNIMFTQKQLQIFRALMSTRSVSEAARRINLSQPSVSRILGDMEREFGCQLFIRRSKGVQPTAEAEAFLQEVERQYSVLRNLKEVAAQIANKERGHLTVATMTAASLRMVPNALRKMRVQENKIAVSWYVKSSNWVIDFTRSGTIKTGFANITNMPTGTRMLYEGTVPHMCLLPKGHALAASTKPLEIGDLRHWPVVGVLGEVADALMVRSGDGTAYTPANAETSFAAIAMSEFCGSIPVVEAFTAHGWADRSGMVARIISDIPGRRFAVFEPYGGGISLLDKEFQTNLIDEIIFVQAWAESLD